MLLDDFGNPAELGNQAGIGKVVAQGNQAVVGSQPEVGTLICPVHTPLELESQSLGEEAVASQSPDQEGGTGAEQLDLQDQGRVGVHMVGACHLGSKNEIKIRKTSLCSSRKSPYPLHGRRSLEIPRGGEALKVKFLEAMYENKLEFPGGRGAGAKQETFRGGSMDIFWSCTL